MFVRCLPTSAVKPLNLSAGLRYIRPQSSEVANYTAPDPSEGPVSEPIPKQVLCELSISVFVNELIIVVAGCAVVSAVMHAVLRCAAHCDAG